MTEETLTRLTDMVIAHLNEIVETLPDEEALLYHLILHYKVDNILTTYAKQCYEKGIEGTTYEKVMKFVEGLVDELYGRYDE